MSWELEPWPHPHSLAFDVFFLNFCFFLNSEPKLGCMPNTSRTLKSPGLSQVQYTSGIRVDAGTSNFTLMS
jgi:hypothetical protein